VQVNVESAAMLPDDDVVSRIDKALKFSPRLLSQWVAGRAFDDLTIAIELPTMQAANNNVRPMTRSLVQLIGYRAGQLLRVDIEGKRALFTIGQFLRLFAAAVRRGDDHGQVAGEIFDVLFAAEIRLARLIFVS